MGQSTGADILDRILESKRTEIESLRHRRGFARALRARRPAIISEVKRRSPSKGLLAATFDPVAIAQRYEDSGCAAISVLTDREYFGGSLNDLMAVHAAVSVPLLRKDFVLDESQIAEGFAAGADAILLIAAALDVLRLRQLREFAETLGLDVLVEAHDGEELLRALDSGASIVGVNNRSLRTFEESLDVSLDLADRIPAHVLKVSESAIRSRRDIDRLTAAGYQAFLVGETLMRSPELLAEMTAP
jgi:indole-3-glycerol phosphate synthase